MSDTRSLQVHMVTHSDDKPYKCNEYKKSISLKTYLKNHMITHTEEKPFPCDICEKSYFPANQPFKAHENKYWREKLFM